eukprot:scaffold5287_cov59-Attheya_sp.AAC.8
MTHHGAKNLMKTVFPAVSPGQFFGVIFITSADTLEERVYVRAVTATAESFIVAKLGIEMARLQSSTRRSYISLTVARGVGDRADNAQTAPLSRQLTT